MMTILIVDDNRPIRAMIRSFVSDLAEQCFECSDGAQALAAYEKHHPDWVLMDIRMKQTDGLAATREIMRAFPKAKVVIVTNYDDDDLKDEARDAGAIGYVIKDDLIALREILGSGCNMDVRLNHLPRLKNRL